MVKYIFDDVRYLYCSPLLYLETSFFINFNLFEDVIYHILPRKKTIKESTCRNKIIEEFRKNRRKIFLEGFFPVYNELSWKLKDLKSFLSRTEGRVSFI